MTHDADVLDESLTRLHRTGPEFDGWLSNHGPMAADALVRLGCGEELEAWVDGYVVRLHEAPRRRWRLVEEDWREVLGDASRLADWCALFREQLAGEPWPEVLARWWPRLLDGAVGAATHGLIRTGHAVRALREVESEARVEELAQALGYWAARHQPLPTYLRGGTAPGEAPEVTAAAVATRDEHAIKLVEVAQESHSRGNPVALEAGRRAAALIEQDD